MKKYFNNFLLLVAVFVVCNFLIFNSSHSGLLHDKTFICQEDFNISYWCPRDTFMTLEENCNFKKRKNKRKEIKIKIKKFKQIFPEGTNDREVAIVITHPGGVADIFYSDEINFHDSKNIDANTKNPKQNLSSFQFEVYNFLGSKARFTQVVHQYHEFFLRSGFCELE